MTGFTIVEVSFTSFLGTLWTFPASTCTLRTFSCHARFLPSANICTSPTWHSTQRHMATENITRYFSRDWDDEDNSVNYGVQHHYELTLITLITTSTLVFTVSRLVTYSIEVCHALPFPTTVHYDLTSSQRLLLSNFPKHSREWCFTSTTERNTKLQRVQRQILKVAAAFAFCCRFGRASELSEAR